MGLVTASSINFDLASHHRVIGYYVYDEMENDVADIREMLVDEQTHVPRYVIIEIGGLLAIRGKKILIPWNALIKGGISRLDVACSQEQVQHAPTPMDYLNPTREEEESIHRYFNAEPYWLEKEVEITTETEEEEKAENGEKPELDLDTPITDLEIERDD